MELNTERQLAELLALRTGATGDELKRLARDVLRQMLVAGNPVPAAKDHGWTSGASHAPAGSAGSCAAGGTGSAPGPRLASIDPALEPTPRPPSELDEWLRMCVPAHERPLLLAPC